MEKMKEIMGPALLMVQYYSIGIIDTIGNILSPLVKKTNRKNNDKPTFLRL